ncbi:MAG TPA: class I SAM-dependent RNA methyltransferase [Myxococcota bacterium]|nr:class I SAM-dependent RNA methyltransferase [Myxococcota bacterium]HQK49840.1 class I SAM-dependent RNA methyltransferase [Myxococcota bacterium]
MTDGTATIRVDRLVHQGMGLGRVGGKVWLVPFTAPGDLVTAVPERVHRGHVEGRLVRVLEEGPDRVPPPCPWYGECGGCHLQHLREERQPVHKAEVLRDVLARIGHVEAPTPVVRSGAPWHWRGRIEVHGEDPKGRWRIGFFRRGSQALVEVQDCPIAHQVLGALIGQLPAALDGMPVQGPVTLELVLGEDGRVVAVIRGGIPDPHRVAEGLLRLPSVRGALVRHRGAWVTSGAWEVKVPTDDGTGGQTLVPTDPRGFSQAHLDLNPALARRVRELAEAAGGCRVLELHAGSGNLTLPLALAGATVTAVEVNGEAARMAARETAARGLEVRWVPLAVESLPARPDLLEGQEVLVMDPPRTGLGTGLARFLAALPVDRVVWVSCDPAPLARDLRPFLEGPFRIDALEMWDLFPQTFHLETLVRLRRRP